MLRCPTSFCEIFLMPGTKQLGQSRKGLKNLSPEGRNDASSLSAAVALSPGQGPAEVNPQPSSCTSSLERGYKGRSSSLWSGSFLGNVRGLLREGRS